MNILGSTPQAISAAGTPAAQIVGPTVLVLLAAKTAKAMAATTMAMPAAADES